MSGSHKTGTFEISKQPKSEEMSHYLLESPEGAQHEGGRGDSYVFWKGVTKGVLERSSACRQNYRCYVLVVGKDLLWKETWCVSKRSCGWQKKCINKVKGNFEPGCLRGQGRKKTKRAPAVRGGAACRKSRFICSDIVTNSGEDKILYYLCISVYTQLIMFFPLENMKAPRLCPPVNIKVHLGFKWRSERKK